MGGSNKVYLLLDHCLASMKFGAFAVGPDRFQSFIGRKERASTARNQCSVQSLNTRDCPAAAAAAC